MFSSKCYSLLPFHIFKYFENPLKITAILEKKSMLLKNSKVL